MTNIIETIITDLNKALITFDADNAAKARAWAKARVTALKAFIDEHKSERRGMGEWAWYEKVFAVAGGKTWYNVFNGRNEEMINEIVDKNSAAIVAKRNVLIAKKLAKFNVVSVGESIYAQAHDGNGFNCLIRIETDNGPKVVEVDTICAGGYNIQCLHNRTLVKVR